MIVFEWIEDTADAISIGEIEVLPIQSGDRSGTGEAVHERPAQATAGAYHEKRFIHWTCRLGFGASLAPFRGEAPFRRGIGGEDEEVAQQVFEPGTGVEPGAGELSGHLAPAKGAGDLRLP